MPLTPAASKALDLHIPGETRDADLNRRRNFMRASILDDDWPQKIAAFRLLYGLAEYDQPFPQRLSAARETLHRRLLNEEFVETMDAKSLDEIVDGLLDLIYVALGWLAEMGFTHREVNKLMSEVHASNMTKTDAEGNPIYDDGGKVLKGEEYVKADIASLIAAFVTARS